jgi:hypothetical protein
MIATYPSQGKNSEAATAARVPAAATPAPADEASGAAGGGYLNEVRRID